MKLTTGVIHSLFIIFSQGLDTYEDIVIDTKGEKRVVRRPFELGALRLTIAINANKLKVIAQSFEEARNSLLRELGGGKEEIKRSDNPEAFDKYQNAVKTMTAEENEVDIRIIKKSDLKLEINPIPVPCLMILEESGILVD